AVKGDCLSALGFIYDGGRYVRISGKPGGSGQTFLARLTPDERVKNDVENEFRKKRAFRIAESPGESDIVLCLCNHYAGDVYSKEQLANLSMLSSRCLSSHAYAFPPEIYQSLPDAFPARIETSIWKADTTEFNFAPTLTSSDLIAGIPPL